jgi:hypothetical protein
MTPEEQQMLNDLANKVAQTPPPQRDPQAEDFIRTRIGSRPDALYLMTQTVLIQNLALDHAKQQIQELQQKLAAAPAPGQPSTFLGGGVPAAPRGSGWGSQPVAYNTPPAPPPPPAAPPPSTPASGGGSSFLRSAATTAAGVAAGALAFEGIRSLFGGIEHLAGFGEGGHLAGGGGFLGGGGVMPSETVINNYYETPEHEARDDRDDDDRDDSRDDDDRNDDSGDDSDDSSYDDSSNGGSFDDGSGDNLV